MYLLGTLCNIVGYNIFSLYSLCCILGKSKISIKGIGVTWFFILLFCLFPLYSGDWIHYQEKVIDFYSTGDCDLESIYGIFLSYTGKKYILFRLIVWGMAILFLRALFYRLDLNCYKLLAFWGIWGLLFFAYPRVSLGLAVFFYGYSFLTKPLKNHLWSYIVGIILISGSCFFHKSIIELVLLVPFTFMSLSLVNVFFYLLFFVCALFFINRFLLMQDLSFIHGSTYFFQENNISTLGEQIVTFFLRGPLFLLLISLLTLLKKKNAGYMSIAIRNYFSFVILIVLLSLVFYFSNAASQVLYYRTLYMVFIPLSIVLASLYPYFKQRSIFIYTFIAYIGGNLWLFYCFLGHMNGSIR